MSSANQLEAHAPNIFRYATSELSQDAVLAWLARWADVRFADSNPAMHKLGRAFISLLRTRGESRADSHYATVGVQLQFKRIDVLVQLDQSEFIIIEDKAGTREHSEQLSRYDEAVAKAFPDAERITRIYYQSENQSSFLGAKGSHYHIVGRADMLRVLDSAIQQSLNHPLINDYRNYLHDIEADTQSWGVQSNALTWSRRAWEGFFSEIQSLRSAGQWEYVPNADGGFVAYWWGDDSMRFTGGSFYCQLSESALEVRVQRNADAISTLDLNDIATQLVQAGSAIPLSRPSRVKSGATSRVSVLYGDYRSGRLTSPGDASAVVALLDEVDEVVHMVARNLNQ